MASSFYEHAESRWSEVKDEIRSREVETGKGTESRRERIIDRAFEEAWQSSSMQ
jgi:hypothetical protein